MDVCLPFALGRKIKYKEDIRPVVGYYILEDELDLLLQNGIIIPLNNEILEELMKDNVSDEVCINTVHNIFDTEPFASPISSFTYDTYGLYAVLEDKSIERVA